MKKLGIFLAAVALIVLCVTLIPTEAQAASSGSCGPNLTWTLDDEGTLTISGTGKMYEYNDPSVTYNSVPWYQRRTSINKVIIENGVTSIGKCAFQNCTSLTEVTIANSVTSISGHAFKGCSALKHVDIPYGVTKIGDHAFLQCSAMISITIPDSVTSIEKYAFNNCTSLISVTIPDGVAVIPEYAFYQCTSLTSVKLGGGVTEIGMRAFAECTNLTDISIPNSVTKIQTGAFENCDSLTNITIPASVTYLSDPRFYSCDQLTAIKVDEQNKNYSSDASGVLFDKKKMCLYEMPGGFSGAYIIPDSVIRIDSFAFAYCTKLTGVTIPNGVTYISDCMFVGCSKLTSVIIPDGVTHISRETFKDCISLTSIVLPKSVTKIEYSAFMNCTSLREISIPAGVDKITVTMFMNCSNLKEILLPRGMDIIEGSAFFGCTALTTVYHKGSAAEWEKIDIENDNDCLLNANIIHDFEGDTIPGTCNHQWQAATCTAPKTCTACGATEGTVGQHSYNTGVITTPATCKEEGIKTYTCTVCNATKTEKVEKSTTHTYDNACDTTCNVCGDVRTISHSYQTAWSKDGTNHWHECSVCRDKTDAAAHTPGPEATETTAQTCTVCGYVIQPVLGHVHSYADAWTIDPDGHWHACDGCEEKDGYEAHIPGPAATATTDQTCTVCGYVLAEATGETTPPSEPATTPATQPETKPNETQPESKPIEPAVENQPSADPTIWIVIAVVVVLGIGAAAVILWKKKK